MKSLYGIFGLINYFSDHTGETRGMRRRQGITKIFVVSGQIEIMEEDRKFIVSSEQEFHIRPNTWHGWRTLQDARIIQFIEEYEEDKEEKKEWFK